MIAWDCGVRWHANLVVGPAAEPIDAEFVRDQHLKSPNGAIDVPYIDRLITVARREAEGFMLRALMPQTWEMVFDRFPRWEIRLERPPLIEVLSITYVDPNGVTQTMAADQYQVSAPRGPMCRRGVVAPAPGVSWPSTQSGLLEAVTVTYRAGYVEEGSPEEANVPENITHGMLLVIGELYKQRSESVIGMGTTVNPALRRAIDMWSDGYKVY